LTGDRPEIRQEPEPFDYPLPPERIAQHPAPRRRDARLLVWEPGGGYSHRQIADLPVLLRSGDLLVLNDTRVFPARLLGRKRGGGATVELLLIHALDRSGRWAALVRPGRRLRPGSEVELDGGVVVIVGDDVGDGMRELRFPPGEAVLEHARRHGHVPLPPYIDRPDMESDRQRYQTVYARHEGSVAAPTAGLHLDRELLATLVAAGVDLAFVTLHVGPGTFRPVGGEELRRGTLHAERFVVPAATVEKLRQRPAGGRVVAVGTTVCRALESLEEDAIGEQAGETRLFIRPGYRFRKVDVLLTNFHLPRSSLLMLVAALAGPRWREAYGVAIDAGYRFYSYGDANWIPRANAGGAAGEAT